MTIEQAINFRATLTNLTTNEVKVLESEDQLNDLVDLIIENEDQGIDHKFSLVVDTINSYDINLSYKMGNDDTSEIEEIANFFIDWVGNDRLTACVHSACNNHINDLYEFIVADIEGLDYQCVDSFEELAQALYNDEVLGIEIPSNLENHIDWGSFEDELKVDGWFIRDGMAVKDC